jgi:hypothetical protein
MLKLILVIMFPLAISFASGYSLRDWISRRRRKEVRKRFYEKYNPHALAPKTEAVTGASRRERAGPASGCPSRSNFPHVNPPTSDAKCINKNETGSLIGRVRVVMIYRVSGPSRRERIAASTNTPRLIRVTAPLAANRPSRISMELR